MPTDSRRSPTASSRKVDYFARLMLLRAVLRLLRSSCFGALCSRDRWSRTEATGLGYSRKALKRTDTGPALNTCM